MQVLAALCSFLLPGLGQFLQGRAREALGFFILFLCLWVLFLGWLAHLLAAWDAAVFAPDEK